MDIAPFFAGQVFEEGKTKLCLTALRDVAKVTVKVAVNEQFKNKSAYIYGDLLTQKEMVEQLGKDVSTLPKVDSEEFARTIEEKQKKGEPTHMEGYMKSLLIDGAGGELGDAVDAMAILKEKAETFKEFVAKGKFEYHR